MGNARVSAPGHLYHQSKNVLSRKERKFIMRRLKHDGQWEAFNIRDIWDSWRDWKVWVSSKPFVKMFCWLLMLLIQMAMLAGDSELSEFEAYVYLWLTDVYQRWPSVCLFTFHAERYPLGMDPRDGVWYCPSLTVGRSACEFHSSRSTWILQASTQLPPTCWACLPISSRASSRVSSCITRIVSEQEPRIGGYEGRGISYWRRRAMRHCHTLRSMWRQQGYTRPLRTARKRVPSCQSCLQCVEDLPATGHGMQITPKDATGELWRSHWQ